MCFKKPFFSLCSLRLYNFYFDNLCNIIKSTAYLIDLLIILEKKIEKLLLFLQHVCCPEQRETILRLEQ